MRWLADCWVSPWISCQKESSWCRLEGWWAFAPSPAWMRWLKMITTNPADRVLASWTREEARPAAEGLKRSGAWWMQGEIPILFSSGIDWFWLKIGSVICWDSRTDAGISGWAKACWEFSCEYPSEDVGRGDAFVTCPHGSDVSCQLLG